MESQVKYKTQPFWVKVVHLVPNDHTQAGDDIVATCHQFCTNAMAALMVVILNY